MTTEQDAGTEQQLKPWWDKPWTAEWSFEDWLTEFEKNTSVAGALSLLDRIFGEIPHWTKQARFLLNLMQELPHSAQTGEKFAPWQQPAPVVIRNKAIEVFATRLLKISKPIDIFDTEPTWMFVMCRDAEAGGTIFRDTLVWLDDEFIALTESPTYHFRSIVKKFLISCAMDRGRFNDAEPYMALRDDNLVSLCRAMLRYGVGYAIDDPKEKWINALRKIVFKGDGRGPADVLQALRWQSLRPAAERLHLLEALNEADRREYRLG